MSLPILVNKPEEIDGSGKELQRDNLLASPWHTVFVLLVLGLYAYWATIRAARAEAGLGPSRPTMYLRTIFFELLFLGIVEHGVKATVNSLLEDGDIAFLLLAQLETALLDAAHDLPRL